MTRVAIMVFGILYYTTRLFDGFNYMALSEVINSKPEMVYTLELDMNKEHFRIENGFSFGVLYGFEKVSEMAEREQPLAAINGMFYNDFGLPTGILIHNSEPVRMFSIGTPSLIISEDNEVRLEEISISGGVSSESIKIILNGVNDQVPNGTWVLFNRVYGSTTRVRRMSTNYLITDYKVTEIIKGDTPVKLNTSDYVLTYAGDDGTFSINDVVNIEFDYGFDGFTIEEGFQTGGWLVRDGKNVAKDYGAFIGYTTASQPRTLVGIREDGYLIFVVVDGRSEKSRGVSGKEAAEMMLSKECVSAAYLDGGASSTMVVEGELVNRPSGGEERAVAHSILIYCDKVE